MEYVLLYTSLDGKNKSISFDDRKKADAVLTALTEQTRQGHAVKLGDDVIAPGTGSLALVAEVVPISTDVENPEAVRQQIAEHQAERARIETGGTVPQVHGFGPTVAGSGDQSPQVTETKPVQQKSQG